MNNDSGLVEFALVISDTKASKEYLDTLTNALSEELLLVGASEVEKLTEKSSGGFRSGEEVFTIGALLIATLPTTIPALIDWIKQWKLRDQSRTIKIRKQKGEDIIELEISTDTPIEKLKELLEIANDNL